MIVWALSYLMNGAEPAVGGWSSGLAAFLGPEGEAVESMAEVMVGTEALHPLTRAALLLHGWRVAGYPRSGGCGPCWAPWRSGDTLSAARLGR